MPMKLDRREIVRLGGGWRVADNTVEKRLLTPRGLPAFGLNFYVLDARGRHAGVSMYPSSYAVCGENGPETLPTESLYEGKPGE